MRENVYLQTRRWRSVRRYVSALLLLVPAVCMGSTTPALATTLHEQHTANTASNSMSTVKNVLNYIERNSNYVFVYNAEVQKMRRKAPKLAWRKQKTGSPANPTRDRNAG